MVVMPLGPQFTRLFDRRTARIRFANRIVYVRCGASALAIRFARWLAACGSCA
jgi:hypothetical protein